MNYKFILPTVCLAMTLGATTLTSCGSDDDDPVPAIYPTVTTPAVNLVGAWRGTWDYFTGTKIRYYSYDFYADGTGRLIKWWSDGMNMGHGFNWSLAGNILIIDEGDEITTMTVAVAPTGAIILTDQDGNTGTLIRE